MHEEVPTKAIAVCFGLAGFVVALVGGLWADNTIDTTVLRALAAMGCCSIVGFAIGLISTRAISANIQAAAEAAKAAAGEAAAAQVQMNAAAAAAGTGTGAGGGGSATSPRRAA